MLLSILPSGTITLRIVFPSFSLDSDNIHAEDDRGFVQDVNPCSILLTGHKRLGFRTPTGFFVSKVLGTQYNWSEGYFSKNESQHKSRSLESLHQVLLDQFGHNIKRLKKQMNYEFQIKWKEIPNFKSCVSKSSKPEKTKLKF